MIKLGRMRIVNFKSFKNPVEFNFTGNDLVLFDGPNGFGKTTIFDAVELCFTGEVFRIEKTDKKTSLIIYSLSNICLRSVRTF